MAAPAAHTPNNKASDTEAVIGLTALLTGLAILSVRSSDETRTVSSQTHSETQVTPCIAPADLAVLSLVLKLGEGQFVHVALAPDGEATIELPAHLPASAQLKPGADIPIVVYRAPPSAANVLSRWQVVGVVHVPE